VLPIMVALTIAPAPSPIAERVRRRFERPAATLARLVGLAVVAGLIAEDGTRSVRIKLPSGGPAG